MKNYRIVASDPDGTLLNNRAEVSSENLEAIKKLSEKDIYFVPSTGRTFAEIAAELRNNPDIRYYIYSNGAVVYDKQTQTKILNCISNNTCREILDVLNNCDSLKKTADEIICSNEEHIVPYILSHYFLRATEYDNSYRKTNKKTAWLPDFEPIPVK